MHQTIMSKLWGRLQQIFVPGLPRKPELYQTLLTAQEIKSSSRNLSSLKKIFCRFTCPYHGWTYSTSGRLTKATRLKGIQDFSPKNFGLIPIAVEKWGPFVYINLTENSRENKEGNKRLL